MNIGQAADRSGVSAKMIRYYESIGLVAKTVRTEAGYRVYSDNDVHTLRFIRRARDLGFSVEQIFELVSLWQDRSRASTDVKRIALEQVGLLERKIEELQSMAATLKHLAKCCHGDDRPDCPILEELASDRFSPAQDKMDEKPVPRFGKAQIRSQPSGRADKGERKSRG